MRTRSLRFIALASTMFASAACTGGVVATDARDEAPADDRGASDVSTGDAGLDGVAAEDALDATSFDAIEDVGDASAADDAHVDAPAERADVAPITIAFQNGVQPSASYAGTVDTYLAESAAATNYATSTTLWADGDVPAGMRNTKVSLVRWDVSAIPNGSRVQSASITVSLSGATNDESTDRYAIYAMLRAWSETQANWSVAMTGDYWAMAGAAELGRDHGVREIGGIPALASGSSTVRLNADGVALVQQWIDDASSNFGVQINSWIADNGLGLASSEATTASTRPKLTVVYAP